MSHSVAESKHAEFHGCSKDQVQSKEVETDSGTRIETTGCGKTESFVCIAAKCRSPRILAVRLFSNANNCKHKDITTEELGSDRFKVKGCGKDATYRCKDDKKDLIECKAE